MMAAQQDSVGYRFQVASQQRCNNSAQLQHIPQTLLKSSFATKEYSQEQIKPLKDDFYHVPGDKQQKIPSLEPQSHGLWATGAV